jgi:hypothetical protein
MQDNSGLQRPIKLDTIAKYALVGAVMGLILISLFLLSVEHSDPSWPRYWQLRPLVVVPLAGAGGGAFFYFMNNFRFPSFWARLLGGFIGLVGFIIALWLGSVVGLDGTLWN